MNNTVEFKIAGSEQLDLMVKSRIDFCLDGKPLANEEKISELISETKEYFTELLKSEMYVGFFGFIENQIVCSAGLLLYRLPPLINRIKRKQGHVLSFFTYPEFRNRGIGKSLMAYIIEYSRNNSINQLYLHATNLGEHVYIKSGFREPDCKAMELKM